MGHPVFTKNGILGASCLKTSAHILPFAQGTAVSRRGVSLDTKINAVAYYFYQLGLCTLNGNVF